MDKKYKLDLPSTITRFMTGKLLDRLNDLNGKEIEVVQYGQDESIVIIDGDEVEIDSDYLSIIPTDDAYEVVIPNMVAKEEMFSYSDQRLKDWINGPVIISYIHDDDKVSVRNLKDERGWVCPMRWLKKIEK